MSKRQEINKAIRALKALENDFNDKGIYQLAIAELNVLLQRNPPQTPSHQKNEVEHDQSAAEDYLDYLYDQWQHFLVVNAEDV